MAKLETISEKTSDDGMCFETWKDEDFVYVQIGFTTLTLNVKDFCTLASVVADTAKKLIKQEQDDTFKKRSGKSRTVRMQGGFGT